MKSLLAVACEEVGLRRPLPSSFAKATEDKSGVRVCQYYKEYASQTDWLFRFKFSVWRIERMGECHKAALSRPGQKSLNKRFTEQFTVKTPQKNSPASSEATSRASSYTPESESQNCFFKIIYPRMWGIFCGYLLQPTQMSIPTPSAALYGKSAVEYLLNLLVAA